jgi:hypothetical protein
MRSNFFMEFDLSGAEWVVVAYLSNDPAMIGVVESGKSPHVVTGSLISGAPEKFVLEEHKAVGMNTDPDVIQALRAPLTIPEGIFLPRSMSIRQAGKKSNHGLNYGMRYKRFALDNEIVETEARMMVELYSTVAYPGISDYWEGIRRELKENDRTLTNCFGRKVRLLDEWGPELWNAAYSFKPQSTVVDCVTDAMEFVYYDDSPEFAPVILGAQVHDSIMMEYPESTPTEWIGVVALRTCEYMRPPLRYSDKDFKLHCDLKVGYSWGDMHTVPWEPDPICMGGAIRQALSLVAASQMPPEAGSSEEGSSEEHQYSPDSQPPEEKASSP